MNIPENYVKLGAVGFSPKGEWNAETTYNRYDVVYHQGSSYIILNDNVVGSNPDTDTTNYIIMAKGVDPDIFQENLKPYLVNNGVTTEEGFALDARYGKVLADSVYNLEGEIAHDTAVCRTISIGDNDVRVTAKNPSADIIGSTVSRYTCLFFAVNQYLDLLGMYIIGVGINNVAIHKITGVDASVERLNENDIRITFNQSGIWSTGIFIAPKQYAI